MLVTLSGIEIEVKPVQSEKAYAASGSAAFISGKVICLSGAEELNNVPPDT